MLRKPLHTTTLYGKSNTVTTRRLLNYVSLRSIENREDCRVTETVIMAADVQGGCGLVKGTGSWPVVRINGRTYILKNF